MLTQSAFAIGDRVRFKIGRQSLRGEVSEDRGPLGVGGRRIYRVLVASDPYESEPAAYELAEEELSPAPQDAPLTNDEIRDYLKNDGLIAILQSNMAGGKPLVWLCRDGLGNVTHTFIRSHGMIGGMPVPFLAARQDRVFRPKRDDVIDYVVRSFDLNRETAEEIVAAIGTVP